MSDIDLFLVTPDDSIRTVMECINRNRKEIALVVDSERRLLGTITDGDIRRSILAGTSMDLPCVKLLENRRPKSHPQPFSKPAGTPSTELLKWMTQYSIRQIPLLNERGQVVDLALLDELVKKYELPIVALVTTSGFGKLHPSFTESTCNLMQLEGDRPKLEFIIYQLRVQGIYSVHLLTRHNDMIAEYFADGSRFGVNLSYLQENAVTGPASALKLLARSNEPLLIILGDTITHVHFGTMLAFHHQYAADVTLVVHQVEFQVPYGVLEMDRMDVVSIREKPTLRYFVDAGVYLISPSMQHYIPQDYRFDMPELIQHLLRAGRRVVSFQNPEY